MPAEQRNQAGRALDLVNNDVLKVVTAVKTLDLGDTDVLVVIPDGTASHYVVTLPPTSAWKGQYIFVNCRHVAGGTYSDGYVVVVGKGDEAIAYTSGHLTAVNDFLLLYSTGTHVLEIKEQTT